MTLLELLTEGFERLGIWVAIFIFAVLVLASHYQQKKALELLAEGYKRHLERIEQLEGEAK